jgi:hypothetical protein
MENYSENKQKSARYSIEQLETQLQELFRGVNFACEYMVTLCTF